MATEVDSGAAAPVRARESISERARREWSEWIFSAPGFGGLLVLLVGLLRRRKVKR